MEASGAAAMKSPPRFYSGVAADPRHHRLCFPANNRIPCELNCRGAKLFARSPARRTIGEVSGLDEKGHVEYYNYRVTPVCGGEKKKEKDKVKAGGWRRVSEKKRAKLLKGLSKNLSMFSELGFGLQSDDAKGKIILEASEVLLTQLEHLRKEEKSVKKDGLMNAKMGDSESSSSSSSESSDSECENGDVVNMSVLRGMMADPPAKKAIKLEGVAMAGEPRKMEEVGVVGLTIDGANADSSTPLKRVEVCMGGKCKKLGAQVLMDEFENVLGSEGSVVACKCMGKCKTAPNVRVRNNEEEDDSIKIAGDPLFIGVRLEDVGSIVAGCFGAEQAGVGAGGAASGDRLAAL